MSTGKRRNPKIKRAVKERVPAPKWENPELLQQIYDLAYEGFYDHEIADEIKCNRSTFRQAKMDNKVLTDTLSRARADAETESVVEIPSLPMFKKVWATCDGKRSKLMEKFGIGWTQFKSWIEQRPEFVDAMADRDLKFLEQCDVAGRIISLGGVKGKDQFPGWSRQPDTWMMRFYMNTIGKKYGYGETPIMPEMEDAKVDVVEDGINIEEWIVKEMSTKKTASDDSQESVDGIGQNNTITSDNDTQS